MAQPTYANTTQLELFEATLPSAFYATNKLGSLAMYAKQIGVDMRYIEPNARNSIRWLVFDIDRKISWDTIWNDLNLPHPTIMVNNPKNGHAHALYALEVPVHRNATSSDAALRFLAAVQIAMGHRLDADLGYTHLICKNPLHDYWITTEAGGVYSLEYLSEFLDLSGMNKKRMPDVGFGRNVNLFNTLRQWAYRAIRQGWPDYNQWLNACTTRAEALNNRSETPLPYSEVKSISKSVAGWTHKHLSPGAFSAWQAAQGRKGGLAKGEAYHDRRSEALELLESGMSASEAAKKLGIHRNTISNWKLHK